MLSRLSAANSLDRLIEEPDNRGPDKRGCTVLTKFSNFYAAHLAEDRFEKAHITILYDSMRDVT